MAPVISAVVATPPAVPASDPPPAAAGGDPAAAAAAAAPAVEPPVTPVSPQESTPVLGPTELSIELTIRAVIRPLSPSSESKPPPADTPRDDGPSARARFRDPFKPPPGPHGVRAALQGCSKL